MQTSCNCCAAPLGWVEMTGGSFRVAKNCVLPHFSITGLRKSAALVPSATMIFVGYSGGGVCTWKSLSDQGLNNQKSLSSG